MLLSPSYLRRRLRRSSLSRFLIAFTLFLIVDALLTIGSLRSPDRSASYAQRSLDTNHTVFIASIHRDSAPRLHSTWSDAVVRLTSHLGPANVYVSAVEAYSADATKVQLLQFQKQLNDAEVGNSVVLGPSIFQLEDQASEQPMPRERRPGWIWNPETEREALRSIPLLATVRNQAMQPLRELEKEGRTFDKVLWIEDDVVFEVEDAVDVLNTRGGEYAAACALSFGEYPRLNYSSALRDEQGHALASLRWPWFQSSTSRSAVHHSEPIPLASCWGGLTALDAAPFYGDSPLEFRALDDKLAGRHVEASETCLVHADNPVAAKGVWMNPLVRVASSVKHYQALKASFPSWSTAVAGSWTNRISRVTKQLSFGSKDGDIRSRVREWSKQVPKGNPERYEPGVACLTDDVKIVKPRVVFRPIFHFPWTPDPSY